MADKIKIIFLVVFIITLPALYAQRDASRGDASRGDTSPAQSYFMETRFIQRLTWSGDEYASRYEVIIEKQTGYEYTRVLQESTKTYFMEVSLSPGRYRYRVIPYDYLDKQGSGSQWIEFEILAALPPELYEAIPDFDSSDMNDRFVLNVYGKNIETAASIYLRTNNGGIINPKETFIFADNSGATLTFDKPHLIPENFLIIVKNPGGLETIMESFVVMPKQEVVPVSTPLPKPSPSSRIFDIYLSAAWMPLFNTFGEMNWLSSSSAEHKDGAAPEMQMAYLCAALRFGAVFNMLKFIDFGMEADALWLNSSGVQDFFMFDINLLAQKFAPGNKEALRFRVGASYVYFLRSQEDLGKSKQQPLHINAGASFLWFAWKGLYVETGFDFLYLINTGENTGGLRPFFGAGWKF